MHRSDRRHILRDDRFDAAPALVDVPVQPPYEPDVGIGVDKYLQVHELPQLRVYQYEQSLDDDHGPRIDVHHLGLSRMSEIIVDRLLDAFARAKGLQMVYEQTGV